MGKKLNSWLLIVTPDGVEARKLVKTDGAIMEDSEGGQWTQVMMRSCILGNQLVYVSALSVEAYQRLKEIATEAENIILHEILKVEPGIVKYVEWMILGGLAILLVVAMVQIGGVRGDLSSKLVELSGAVENMSRLLDVPRVINP